MKVMQIYALMWQVLFEEKRSAFLEKMPPFSGDLSKRLISLQEGMGCASQNVEPVQPAENAATNTLFKLQVGLVSACLCNFLKLWTLYTSYFLPHRERGLFVIWTICLMLFGEMITTCSAGQVVLKYWRIIVPASFRLHSVCVRKHLALALHGWRWQRESRWWTSMVKGNCAVVWLHQTKCISGCVFLIMPAFSPIH